MKQKKKKRFGSNEKVFTCGPPFSKEGENKDTKESKLSIFFEILPQNIYLGEEVTIVAKGMGGSGGPYQIEYIPGSHIVSNRLLSTMESSHDDSTEKWTFKGTVNNSGTWNLGKVALPFKVTDKNGNTKKIKKYTRLRAARAPTEAKTTEEEVAPLTLEKINPLSVDGGEQFKVTLRASGGNPDYIYKFLGPRNWFTEISLDSATATFTLKAPEKRPPRRGFGSNNRYTLEFKVTDSSQPPKNKKGKATINITGDVPDAQSPPPPRPPPRPSTPLRPSTPSRDAQSCPQANLPHGGLNNKKVQIYQSAPHVMLGVGKQYNNGNPGKLMEIKNIMWQTKPSKQKALFEGSEKGQTRISSVVISAKKTQINGGNGIEIIPGQCIKLWDITGEFSFRTPDQLIKQVITEPRHEGMS